MKKASILFLCICILSGQLSGVCHSYPLTDINEVDPAAQPLIEMNILEGYTDGDLKLDCEISRAEFAKMVYVLINGVDDSAEQYVETTAFQDMQNHWARAYAEYAQQSGLMVGANGHFRPNDTITIVEVTKVILCILGFDAEENGMVGSGWKESTIALGKEHDIFTIFPNTHEKKATRRNVCEIFNYLLRNVKHSSKNADEYGVIIESSYDFETNTANVTINTLKGQIETYMVSEFYTADEKYQESLLNDTAEQFADNRKLGYVYHYDVKEDGTVDLSLEHGVAPDMSETIVINNNIYENGKKTNKGIVKKGNYYYPLKKVSQCFMLGQSSGFFGYAGVFDQDNIHFESNVFTGRAITIGEDEVYISAIITEENQDSKREAFFVLFTP